MRFTTTVRLQAEDPAQTLEGLKVELYDRDYFSSDDLLGSSTTNERGEALFHYVTEDFVSWEERLTGNEFPALYAVVYGPAGDRLVSSKAEIRGNTAAKFLDVRIPRAAPVAEPAGHA
jgi:hypothetical protein